MQSQYLSRADEKLAELSVALNAFVGRPDDVIFQRRLRRLLHNLIGSGGTFGFTQVSKAARSMAEQFRQTREQDGQVDGRSVNALESRLDKIRKAFKQARSAHKI